MSQPTASDASVCSWQRRQRATRRSRSKLEPAGERLDDVMDIEAATTAAGFAASAGEGRISPGDLPWFVRSAFERLMATYLETRPRAAAFVHHAPAVGSSRLRRPLRISVRFVLAAAGIELAMSEWSPLLAVYALAVRFDESNEHEDAPVVRAGISENQVDSRAVRDQRYVRLPRSARSLLRHLKGCLVLTEPDKRLQKGLTPSMKPTHRLMEPAGDFSLKSSSHTKWLPTLRVQ
jgi:hypothetical protein